MKSMLLLALTLVLTATAAAGQAAGPAESEAMQRERALNRILVSERLQREKDMASRGSGLMGIKHAPVAKASSTAKAPPSSSDQASKRKKNGKRQAIK